MVGQTLGPYRIVRQLGSGGMGAVFEAVKTPSGERFAIKVISTGDLVKDKALVGRFHREARTAAAIDTDHIVRTFETGTDAATQQPFMVMEYLVGEDLQQLFARLGPLPPKLALRIIGHACEGLAKAHEARVVHRDIKPANIFLAERPDNERIAKILDFGIAKIKMDQASAAETTGLTRTGSMVGSPLYMSPEQARGSKSIDHRADIWSLGIVFYQALAGRTPNHDIEALGELIIAICSEPPKPLQDVAPWVPPEIAEIVHKTLLFDPADRYQSAREMLAAIERVAGGKLAITADMVHAITPETKARVAAKMLTPIPASSLRMRSSIPLFSASNDDAAQAASLGAPATNDGLAQPAPSRPGRSVLPFVVGGAILVGAGGAFALFSVSIPPEPRPVVEATSAAAAPLAPAPPAPAAASTNVAATAVGPVTHAVGVVIMPSDATVEVAGEPRVLRDGVLAIRGPLGSVHPVHVSKGARQVDIDVVVTDSGAFPPKIELEIAAPAKSAQPAAAPKSTTSAKTSTSPAPVPAPRTKAE